MRLAKYFILFILFPLNVYSIQNVFNYITPEDGLSQGNITCIYQDSQGFMWFGTFNGLNRYDGYSIKIYNHDINDSLSLGYGHVKYICEDDENKLWFGTYGGGISVFYPKKGIFRNITSVMDGDVNVPLRNLAGITNGPDGNIWVLEENNGLFVFDKHLNFIKAYRSNSGRNSTFPAVIYHGLLFDKNETLWIAGGNGTLLKHNKDNDTFEQFIFEERTAAADDGVRSVYYDSKGIIWIGTTSQGAYSFDPLNQSFKNYRKGTTEYDLSSNTIMGFIEDWEGNLLIATDGGGINILNRQSYFIDKIRYELGNPVCLSTDAVYSLYVDRTETLWVGTYAGGINYYGRYKNKFYTYKPEPLNPNSVSYKNVKCFLQDSDGEIWVGTDGGGINKFNILNNEFEHYKANPEDDTWLQTNIIIHLAQDNDGDIYIGSYSGGLTIFNKTDNTFKQYLPDASNPDAIGGMHVWNIYQDSYGVIWVGMLAVGLDQFDKETQTFTHYSSDVNDPATLNSPNIKVIYEDKKRQLWIGTEGGGLHLFNRDANNFTRYIYRENCKNCLSNNDVRAIYQDSKNRFWVGTGDGLNLMDKKKGTFTVISVEDGLPGKIINDILEDDNGNLWISTNNGISRFNPDEKKFRNYDISDGLQGNEFNYTAAMKSREGDFYFGGKSGFNVFKPADIKDNPHIPPIVVTNFKIANKPIEKLLVKINRRKEYRTINYVDEIKLSHKDNIFEFEFAALDFGNPGKNKYKYKLEGFDEEWTEVNATKRFASYTNLDGGEYIFRVIGSNSDDKWNETGLSIKLIVTPPFWKRKSTIILFILLNIFIGYVILRRRRQKIIEEKALLNEKISKGLEEVEKQKTEVTKKDNEIQKKIEAEKMQNWYNTGLDKINKVITNNKDDLFKLSQSIIVTIVEYIEVAQGALYLINSDDEESEPYLEIMASYAPDSKRLIGQRLNIIEGNIGACYKEQKIFKINNLPEKYAHFSSGLGEMSLKNLTAIPLKLNEISIGVIELLSFEPVEEHKINFVAQTGETLTSILTALKANERTKKLLDQQKILAEESAAHEEELRQNLEELQATQEESTRRAEQLTKITDDFQKKEQEYEKIISDLEKKLKDTKKGK